MEILPKLNETFDCIFIDGDHNWYTVYSELKTIEERGLLAANGGILFHDVGWPYGRRDMYYVPESIPQEFRHAYAQKGISGNKSELSQTGGFNTNLNNAVFEGGQRNGVLTAIKDFIKFSKNKYGLLIANQQHGLGILIHLGDEKTSHIFRKWRIKILKKNMLTIIPYGVICEDMGSECIKDKVKNLLRTKSPALFSILKGIKNQYKNK